MKYYILTENRHNQILLFDSFKDAFNWCKSATRWTDAEIKANIKTASKMGSHYSILHNSNNSKKERLFPGVRFPGLLLPHKRILKIERWYYYDN